MADDTPIAAQPVVPAAECDDGIRKEIARYIIFSDLVICVLVLVLIVVYGTKLPDNVLAIAATIVGTIVGNRAQNTATVVGYEFGSSSGSKAKTTALLEAKK